MSISQRLNCVNDQHPIILGEQVLQSVSGFPATWFNGRLPRMKTVFRACPLLSSTFKAHLLHINGSVTSAGESSSGSREGEEVTSSRKTFNLHSPNRQGAGWSKECVGRGRVPAPFLPGSLNFSGSEDLPTRAPAFLQPTTDGQTPTGKPLSHRPTLRTSSASSTPRPLARPWRQGLTLAGGCVEGRQQLGGR